MSSQERVFVSEPPLTYDCRTNDDDALRLKVEEAMTVYDEYIRNQGGPVGEDAATANGTENVNPAGDAGKDAE